jgi:hypothetical protein
MGGLVLFLGDDVVEKKLAGQPACILVPHIVIAHELGTAGEQFVGRADLLTDTLSAGMPRAVLPASAGASSLGRCHRRWISQPENPGKAGVIDTQQADKSR